MDGAKIGGKEIEDRPVLRRRGLVQLCQRGVQIADMIEMHHPRLRRIEGAPEDHHGLAHQHRLEARRAGDGDHPAGIADHLLARNVGGQQPDVGHRVQALVILGRAIADVMRVILDIQKMPRRQLGSDILDQLDLVGI